MLDKYTVSLLDFSKPVSGGYMDLCGFKWTFGGSATYGADVKPFNTPATFNGSDGTLYATLPAIGTQDFTWDWWIKPTGVKTYSSVLEVVGFQLRLHSSTGSSVVGNDYISGNPQVDYLNKWFHLRFARKNLKGYSFVNGVLVNTPATYDTNLGSLTWRFGEVWDSTAGYDYLGNVGLSHLRVGIGLTKPFKVPPLPTSLPGLYTKKVPPRSLLVTPSIQQSLGVR